MKVPIFTTATSSDTFILNFVYAKFVDYFIRSQYLEEIQFLMKLFDSRCLPT